MGIFKRVADILSANVNDMVERFESPETMLRQAIREMDAAIARQMELAARAIADERVAENELRRLQEQSTQLHESARQAVARNDDESAKRKLARRRDVDKLVLALESQLQDIHESGKRLRSDLEAMRIRRREAEHSQRLLIARRQSSTARRQLSGVAAVSATDDCAFSRFDRVQEKIERDEAESEAILELHRSFAEVDEPEADVDCLEFDLAALKQQQS